MYEMLTGTAAFPGETVSDTIAKILEREPEFSALPADTPQTLQRLVRRCLQKDKSMRLQDVGEVRVEVDGILSGASEMWTGPVAVTSAGVAPARRGASRAWIAVAVVATIAAIGFAGAWLRGPSDTSRARVIRTSIAQPRGARFVSLGDYAGPVVISPDGTRVAFVANDASLTRMLFVRDLDALEAVALPGTVGAAFPFWSSDGRSLGYFTDTRLMRVELSGGLPITVCPAVNGRGGSWSDDGVIVFSPDFRVPIHSVPASGGTPVAVTALDTTMHSTHRWPVAMPGGKHFIYVAAHHDVGLSEHYGVYFASFDGAVNKRIISSGATARYASGYLLYLRESTLMAAEFDPVKGEFTGEPMTMVDKVQYDPTTWYAAFSVSQSGLLAYHGAGDSGLKTRLVIIDRAGKETSVVDETDIYYHLSISPDGKRLACTAGGNSTLATSLSVWLYDLEHGRRTRLTFSDGADISPVWSSDGERLAYATIYPGSQTRMNRVTVAMTDGGGEEVLIENSREMWLTDWSRDGRYLVYTEGSFVSGGGDIYAVPMFGDRKPFPFLVTEFDEDGAALSPDGRWIVYTSREQGQMQLFVAPFVPPVEAGGSPDDRRGFVKWQISTDLNLVEGTLAKWRSDGKEILFITTDGRIWSAVVDGSGDSFHVGRVEMLCTTDPWNFGRIGFDVTPDGNGFVVNSFSKSATPPITLVQNWTLDLKR
jgi:Tol biopolymer transport system component